MSFIKNMSPNDFFEILSKRLNEYPTAIMGNSGSSTRMMYMKTTQHINMLKLRSIITRSKLLQGDLYGYGVNSISDGEESHSQPDVNVVKKINELNKHQKDYRLLWVLTFKIVKDSLFVSIFCIDTCSSRVNSNLNLYIRKHP